MDEFVVADTSVISRLTKASEHSRAYDAMIGDRRLAISFQTPAELQSAQFSASRQRRIDDLLSATLKLPHAESTDVWYGRVASRRKDLRKLQQPGGDASDADMWIIGSALEWGLPLISHDRKQVRLGRAMGLRVLTNLPELRGDNPAL